MTLRAEIAVDKDHDGIYRCLLPEAKRIKRSELSLKNEKEGLVISFKADDYTALRAAVNSVLRLLTVYEKVKSIQG